MHGLTCRSLPAERSIAAAHAPDAHAARRQHLDANLSVVKFNDLHAFGATAATRAEADVPRRAGGPGGLELGRVALQARSRIDEDVLVNRHVLLFLGG
jgi:hypothetical protein